VAALLAPLPQLHSTSNVCSINNESVWLITRRTNLIAAGGRIEAWYFRHPRTLTASQGFRRPSQEDAIEPIEPHNAANPSQLTTDRLKRREDY
jgi:hypothetical protein